MATQENQPLVLRNEWEVKEKDTILYSTRTDEDTQSTLMELVNNKKKWK